MAIVIVSKLQIIIFYQSKHTTINYNTSLNHSSSPLSFNTVIISRQNIIVPTPLPLTTSLYLSLYQFQDFVHQFIAMMALFPTICLCSILLLVSRLLHKLWWKPIQTQKFLRSQGINGPTYRILHGNTKEILEMKKEALSNPYELTQHDVFPRVFPHLNAWNKLYGKNPILNLCVCVS